MKTAVVFKWTRNPSDAIVRASGDVEWNGVKMSPTDDDPAAIDIAKAISSEDDIVGVTVGDGKPEWAAARGAAKTIVVEGVEALPDGRVAASAIAKAISLEEGIEVVTIGDSDWDRSVPCALVGMLQWKAYANVVSAEVSGEKLLVTIKNPDGNVVVETSTPVLLETLALGQEESVPGMKQTLAARKKPLDKVAAGSIGVEPCLAESLGTKLPEGQSATLFDGEDPDSAVSQLLSALRSEGVLA